MFSKGEKVVYPMYGAGVIEGLEETYVDGQKKEYYVLFIPVSNLRIKVSVTKADSLGIRRVSQKDEIVEMIRKAVSSPTRSSENWNQRYQDNMMRIKTGHLTEVAGVFKSLLERERGKTLSTAEKKMMTNAKQILLSEIVLAQNVEKNEAEDILFQSLSSK